MSDTFVTVLVVSHPRGISVEGANHQRSEAIKALGEQGLEVIGNTMGASEKPAHEAWRIVRAVWEVGS